MGEYEAQSSNTGLLSLTSVMKTTTTAVEVCLVLGSAGGAPGSRQHFPSSVAVTFNSYLSLSSSIIPRKNSILF